MTLFDSFSYQLKQIIIFEQVTFLAHKINNLFEVLRKSNYFKNMCRNRKSIYLLFFFFEKFYPKTCHHFKKNLMIIKTKNLKRL